MTEKSKSISRFDGLPHSLHTTGVGKESFDSFIYNDFDRTE
jgi:hypothetical protein